MNSVDRYELIRSLSDDRAVDMVRRREDGLVCVSKLLSVYNEELYRLLMEKKPRGIPKIYGIEREGELLRVFEEYIPGRTLEEVLNESGPAPEEWAKGIILSLCDTLKQLHSYSPPVIHRDIKPSNIIITPEHEAVLIDLNAAQFVDPERSRDTRLMGTQGYAAPEQFGFQRSDQRADIYALGVLLNEMLVGRLPREELTAGNYRDLVERCIRPDPNQRFQSVEDVKKELGGIGRPAQLFRRFLPPGFRSGNPGHMIIALSVDAFYAWLVVGSLCQSREGLSAHNLTAAFFQVVAYLIVVAFVTDYLDIHRKLRIDRIRPVWLRLPVIVLLCILFILFMLFIENQIVRWY